MDVFVKPSASTTKKNFSFAGDQPDYYEILNISKNSTKSQIREAYIRLKNAFSSQSQALYSLVTEAESEQMLASIEDAFRILNDDKSKRHYDTKIGLCVSEAQRVDMAMDNLDVFSGKLTNEFDSTNENEMKPRYTPASSARSISAELVDLESTRTKMKNAIEDFELHDGELYKKLREIAGVSEEEMQDRTKISLAYIRAIEQNTFANLPSPVFVKGFLRSYLKYLKVQEVETMVKAFAARYENWIQGKTGKS